MKTVLIGSVSSSEIMLNEMIKCKFPITYVFGLDESKSPKVSGYVSLCELAEKNGIPNKCFLHINSEENIKLIKEISPDYIFVIGLSQMVSKEIIDAAKLGVIGCHPAPLPKYRGRAAVVWQMLMGETESKCSLFMIDEGMDSGDILGQETYLIGRDDYAADVQDNINCAFSKLCAQVLPKLMDGTVVLEKQDHELATYTLLRTEADGQICWGDSIQQIQLLIRAVSKPYPGAFSFYDGKNKVVFNRAEILENKRYIGFPGQIAEITEKFIDIVAKDGLLRVTDYSNEDNVILRVGHRFKEV